MAAGNKRAWWDPTPLAFFHMAHMIWQGMSGNGAQIGTVHPTTKYRREIILPDLQKFPNESCEGEVGAEKQAIFVVPIVTMLFLQLVSLTWASASPRTNIFDFNFK
jgi:hypothetical protein